jgi:curli production assembly/transport component CsgE
MSKLCIQQLRFLCAQCPVNENTKTIPVNAVSRHNEKQRYWTVVFLFFLVLLPCGNNTSAEPLETEIEGLVLDRSITRFGKEFYREFSVLWRDVKGTSGYNVVVLESVIPRSGTVLWLEINQTKVFQTFFGRRNNTTTRVSAEIAVQRALGFLAAQSFQTNTPDLLGDGF